MMIENTEVVTLTKEFQELQRFNNRLKTIERLKQDAEQEQDPELIHDSYKTILRMQERLYAEIVTYISDEHTKLFKRLEAVCMEQRENIGTLADIIGYLINLDDAIETPAKQRGKSHLKLIKKEGRQ